MIKTQFVLITSTLAACSLGGGVEGSGDTDKTLAQPNAEVWNASLDLDGDFETSADGRGGNTLSATIKATNLGEDTLAGTIAGCSVRYRIYRGPTPSGLPVWSSDADPGFACFDYQREVRLAPGETAILIEARLGDVQFIMGNNAPGAYLLTVVLGFMDPEFDTSEIQVGSVDLPDAGR